MDISDEATAHEEQRRDEAIARRKTTVQPCGHCHNCSEPIGSSEIFCPGGCAEDWQKRQDAKTRNGV